MLDEEGTRENQKSPRSAEPPIEISPREREVWEWLRQGKSNPEIAGILGISTRTVHKHCENLFRKLGVENRLAAALFQSGGLI